MRSSQYVGLTCYGEMQPPVPVVKLPHPRCILCLKKQGNPVRRGRECLVVVLLFKVVWNPFMGCP